jgi:hypothetical protein
MGEYKTDLRNKPIWMRRLEENVHNRTIATFSLEGRPPHREEVYLAWNARCDSCYVSALYLGNVPRRKSGIWLQWHKKGNAMSFWKDIFGRDEEELIIPEPPREIFISGPGFLDPTSQTWMFIRNWAGEALQRAREKNDNVNCDLSKTSALRGEIKILKELIHLPEPKRGLLEED